ncbi:hypothetical protein HYW67_00160 [Candidatus Parcubacteria bacterium]|nr:hypothetical protein [Candidatus Parcubacteria bacterium]
MDQNKKHLFILLGLGVAVVIFIVIAFYQKPTPGPQPGPTPPPDNGAPANDLPKDLRVVSGKITNIAGSSMTIEWTVPQKLDFSEIKVFPKHITWTNSTTFSRVRADAPGAKPEVIKSSDLKIGQTVVVSTLETVQDHFELTALSIQVQVPPTPK